MNSMTHQSAAAMITKGNDISNVTLGGGIMGVNNEINKNSSSTNQSPYTPLYYLNIAYANRFSKHFAVNFENFLFPQNVPYQQKIVNINITGVSLKWLVNKNNHWNFGCHIVYVGNITGLTKNSNATPIPYIGYSSFF